MHTGVRTMIRCFIAVPLPADVRNNIDAFLRELNKSSQDVKWVRAGNIHLTLKFFGEIEAERIEKIKTLLPALNGVVKPFRLVVDGSGCFPDKRRPRVFWLALGDQGRSELQQVYNWLEDHLATLGFEKEKRKFSPHLTLGRVRRNADFTLLFDRLKMHPFPASAFTVTCIELIRSELMPSGARYTTLAAVNL